jgi:hypothetical protein
MIDGISGTALIDTIVSAAQVIKGTSVQARKMATAHIDADDIVSARAWASEHIYRENRLAWTVAPLMKCIVKRTNEERSHAYHAAELFHAHFHDEGRGIDCGDCEHPMEYHIVVGTETVCPFGRHYWNLARILDVGFGVVKPELTYVVEIAKATAQHGAPVWKRAARPLPF